VWTGNDGLDVDNHREYLLEFCEQFYSNVVRLVDKTVEANIRYLYIYLFISLRLVVQTTNQVIG